MSLSSTPEAWWPSRYGKDDQLGMLNEITAAKVAAAARLVRRGTVYDLGRTLDAGVPAFEGRFWRQTLVRTAHLVNAQRPDGGAEGWGRNHLNWITEPVTGTLQIGTHLDGLNHLQIGDRCYNGWRTRDIAEEWGTNRLGVETVPSVVTRGVLVDVARFRGVESLEAGEVVTPDDLEGALRAEGVRVEPGDAFLVHTGWGRLWEQDAARFVSGEPGVGMAAAKWLVARRVALTGADTWSFGAVPGEDRDRPFLVPQILNVRQACSSWRSWRRKRPRAGVYEFTFVLTHAKTRGSTAAMIAPTAVT